MGLGGMGGMAGKKNFRSKRFSRNLERDPPALKRAQSFNMDQRQDGDIWLDAQRRLAPTCPIVVHKRMAK
jgi:hypothetical protein